MNHWFLRRRWTIPGKSSEELVTPVVLWRFPQFTSTHVKFTLHKVLFTSVFQNSLRCSHQFHRIFHTNSLAKLGNIPNLHQFFLSYLTAVRFVSGGSGQLPLAEVLLNWNCPRTCGTATVRETVRATKKGVGTVLGGGRYQQASKQQFFLFFWGGRGGISQSLNLWRSWSHGYVIDLKRESSCSIWDPIPRIVESAA